MQHPKDKIISLLQTVPATAAAEPALVAQLGQLLNELIQQNFGAVVQLLYRVDVPEGEVRGQLQQQTDEDAGIVLARLLVQRQKEKAILRQQFRSTPPAEDDAERW